MGLFRGVHTSLELSTIISCIDSCIFMSMNKIHVNLSMIFLSSNCSCVDIMERVI